MMRRFHLPLCGLLSSLFPISLLLAGSVVSNIFVYAEEFPTNTPIKYLVVLFQENSSFDHYFATYPVATNPVGEPQFIADPNTPFVNNLRTAGVTLQAGSVPSTDV